MDPNEALANAVYCWLNQDEYEDVAADLFVEFMQGLSEWIHNGGFLPSSKPLIELRKAMPNTTIFKVNGWAERFRYDSIDDLWYFELLEGNHGDKVVKRMPLSYFRG